MLFACPARRLAAAHAVRADASNSTRPVDVSVVDLAAVKPDTASNFYLFYIQRGFWAANLINRLQGGRNLGAFHGQDLAFLFGQLAVLQTPVERAITRQLTQLVLGFVHVGPDALAAAGAPAWSGDFGSMLVLDRVPFVRPFSPRESLCLQWDRLPVVFPREFHPRRPILHP